MIANRISRILMLGVGVTHLIPVVAALSRSKVEALYGVAVPNADIELLLRHRAVLFGLIGSGVIAGAFSPRYRHPALLAALLSTGSYLALAHTIGDTNEQLDRVKQIDIIAVASLATAAAITRRSPD